MTKKKLIFVIHRLGAGGAEKSLASLLNSLPLDDYEVDVMALDPTGIFRNQVPHQCHMIEAPKEMICMSSLIKSSRFWCNVTPKLLFLKLACILKNHLRSKKSWEAMDHSQYYQHFFSSYIPKLKGEYDVAISYMDGLNYYVVDKISAKKKILWVHNDYNKYTYISSFDLPYFEKADKVITISNVCKKSLVENFPSIADKFDVVENISSSRIINIQKFLPEEDPYFLDNKIKLISIGRLAAQKGFDMAIEAARLLKQEGVDFKWYIMGDGVLRRELEETIHTKGVADVMILMGIRSNPYPYIAAADVFVMPSRFEGKSIALDEAKILQKPIVVTNYSSVTDAIKNGVTGVITDINAQSIAAGIKRIITDNALRNQIVQNLKAHDYSNEKIVVGKIIDIIEK